MFSVDIKEDFVKVGRVLEMRYKFASHSKFLILIQNDYDKIVDLILKIKVNKWFLALFGTTIELMSRPRNYVTNLEQYTLIIYIVSLIDSIGYDDLLKMYWTTFIGVTTIDIHKELSSLKENIRKLKAVNEDIYNNPEYEHIL